MQLQQVTRGTAVQHIAGIGNRGLVFGRGLDISLGQAPARAQAYMLLTAAPVEGRYGGVVDLPNSSASLALPTGIFDTDILPKGALNDAARFGRPGTRCNLT